HATAEAVGHALEEGGRADDPDAARALVERRLGSSLSTDVANPQGSPSRNSRPVASFQSHECRMMGTWKRLHPYRYVYNRPTNTVDPSGLIGIFFGGTRESSGDETRTIFYLKQRYDQSKNGPAYFDEMPGLFTVFVRAQKWTGPWANFVVAHVQQVAKEC